VWRRARLRGHPVVVQLIGQRQVQAADLARPPWRGQIVIDEFCVPGPSGLDAVGLVTRPGDCSLATTEFGEKQLEATTPISCLHSTPQSQLG
jgi:hypothetical protein